MNRGKSPISVVLGGTRGIGYVITNKLQVRGDNVYTISRSISDNKNHISIDLSDKDKIYKLKNIFKKKIINNLIFCQRYRGNDWDEDINVSLSAVYHTIEALSDNLNGTSIVIISSNASKYVLDEQPASYHATRSALNGLMRYYSVNLGYKGIRCNCILPTTVIKPENQAFFVEDNGVRKLIESITPLRKMGSAKHISYLVEFLCSNKSSFITGQEIFVDGGINVRGQESIARQTTSLNYNLAK